MSLMRVAALAEARDEILKELEAWALNQRSWVDETDHPDRRHEVDLAAFTLLERRLYWCELMILRLQNGKDWR